MTNYSVLHHTGGVIEYTFDKNTRSHSSEPPKQIIKSKELSAEDFTRLYHKEELIEIAGKRIPIFVVSQISDLEGQMAKILPSPYEIPPMFEKFGKEVLKLKNPGHYNGSCIGIREITPCGQPTQVEIQKTKYFSFIATDASQDLQLSQFDPSFDKGVTLRDYEIIEGKSVGLKNSILANILGVGFLLLNSEENYFILGRRRGNLGVYANSVGIFGGTPTWDVGWRPDSIVRFGQHIIHHINEEMKEEARMDPKEFRFESGFWVRDLKRAPTLLTTLSTKLSIETIFDRCRTEESSLSEHSSFLRVPANAKTLSSIVSDSNYRVNTITAASMYLSLKV